MIINAELKHIRSLHKSKGRLAHGQYIIEGRRLFKEVILTNGPLHLAYYTDTFQNNFPTMVDDITKMCPTKKITAAEMKTVSATETPSGILGICIIPDYQKSKIIVKENSLFLDNISDPGNMGTLLRTAAWFGINHIFLTGDCVDVYNPKVVRGGMGAHFNITANVDADIKQFTSTHSIIAADQNGKDLTHLSLSTPWVLVLGSEAHGISKNTREHIKHFIAIPRLGSGESLNVAVAGGVLISKLTSIN